MRGPISGSTLRQGNSHFEVCYPTFAVGGPTNLRLMGVLCASSPTKVKGSTLRQGNSHFEVCYPTFVVGGPTNPRLMGVLYASSPTKVKGEHLTPCLT
ncbi:unnamed protein product [Prunus armeniaca]